MSGSGSLDLRDDDIPVVSLVDCFRFEILTDLLCALCEATARVWHREAGTPTSVREPVVIAPEGELDLYSVDALVTRFEDAAAADCPHLILDLSAVTLVDSTALGAIIQVQHRFNRQGRKLSVVAPAGSAAAVLVELSGLRSHFSLFGSRDAALA
jgi:anti-anti-sigma factor